MMADVNHLPNQTEKVGGAANNLSTLMGKIAKNYPNRNRTAFTLVPGVPKGIPSTSPCSSISISTTGTHSSYLTRSYLFAHAPQRTENEHTDQSTHSTMTESAALVSKEEQAADTTTPREPAEAGEISGAAAATEDGPTSAAAAEEPKKPTEEPAASNTTGGSGGSGRARSTPAGAASVPPILPQRSILRKPSREYHPTPTDPASGAAAGTGMAAHKRYYDYPPPPQGAAAYAYRHPNSHHRHAPAHAQQYRPGALPPPPMMAAVPHSGGSDGGPPFRPFAHHHRQNQGYAARYGGAAEHYYQYHPQYAAAAAAAAHFRSHGHGGRAPDGGSGGGGGPPPRVIAMGPGRGPLPPWLGGPGGSGVSPLRPPPPRAHFRPRAHEAYRSVGRRLALAEEAGDGDNNDNGANTGGPAAKRDSKYDDALLLAEVSKIAETEAHHRKEAEAEASSNSSSGGSTASTDGDAAGGIKYPRNQDGKKGEALAPSPIKKEGDDEVSEKQRASVKKVEEELDSARRSFSDQAKTGSLASPVIRPARANDDRNPPNRDEPYAEHYYPPAASSYPMPHMSLRMQAGQDHRRGNSGELFYSPGGPYPVRAGAGRYYPQEYEGGDPDGAGERPSRPPPEYTPPTAYFNRHAPRPPSKHVEVTPNSHDGSPLSRSKRPRDESEEEVEGDAASPEAAGAGRSTQRRARFDETTERDQEDRDRRRAAAAAEAAVKASGGSAIPPFPSPRWGAGVSAGDEKTAEGQPKPYLPPPRPTTGTRFPYQDDESRLAGEYVPTVTPRGGETSKPVHTFNSARPTPTPPPQDHQPEGPGWSPYPLNHHRRIPSGGFEFTIRPRDFGTPGGPESGIVSTWGKSASWDNEEGAAIQGSPLTPSTPSKAPRTPQKGYRNLPSVSMDYGDSPPGNAVFTPRSSFDPMAESHRFLPPTPGGFYSDPADYLDYGDYQYVESSGPSPQHQYASSAALPPPHMMAPPRHPGSPQALAPRQFVAPSSSGGSKYPPLSAFQPDGSAGGYYGGGDNYYAGKTIIRRKCPWKNFPEVSVIAMVCIGRNCVLCSRSFCDAWLCSSSPPAK